MKNSLKNISQEEKNRILEMYILNKTVIKENSLSMVNTGDDNIKDFIKTVTSYGFKHDPLTKINPTLFYVYRGKPLVFTNNRKDLPATIFVDNTGKGIVGAGYYGTENFKIGPIDKEKIKFWIQKQLK